MFYDVEGKTAVIFCIELRQLTYKTYILKNTITSSVAWFYILPNYKNMN